METSILLAWTILVGVHVTFGLGKVSGGFVYIFSSDTEVAAFQGPRLGGVLCIVDPDYTNSNTILGSRKHAVSIYLK